MQTPLTQNIGPDKTAPNLAEYEANGGYQGARKALLEMSPADVLQVVKDSNLRGRGGAGFPTGMKWSFVPMGEDVRKPKYLVVNADEMEPGTFKDRILMEDDPHQLIEGMIVSAYTLDAEVGYIFIRGEYKKSAEMMLSAVAECREKGYLGKNIFGTDFDLDIFVHTSAGRYICGEETALLNSLEGKRANPRAKPPFPQISGLWGRPTVVNNVETICNIHHIVNYGADWFKGLSLTEDAGTKLFGVSGRVNTPGTWELPLGTTVREIIDNHAGGMQEGYKLRGFLPGGGSTNFLTDKHLDLHADYSAIAKAGSRLGTGTMILLDDQTCPVGMVRNLEQFFAQESCGFCTPCRDGLPWVEKILGDLDERRGEQGDLETLERQTHLLGPGNTFCAHAPGAMGPLESALRYFREDFEAHLHGECPWSGIIK